MDLLKIKDFSFHGNYLANQMRDEALKTRIMTDPHSPGMYRGYVPLLHTDSFYEAFNIEEGDQMYLNPQERVKIW